MDSEQSNGGGDHLNLRKQSNLEPALTAVCQAAVSLVGVDHSGLALFDRDRRWGVVKAEFPPGNPSFVGEKIQIAGIRLEEELASTGTPIVISRIEEEQSLGPVKSILERQNIKSIVVVPIIVDGKIEGSFSFDSIEKIRDFDDADVQKCKSLADFGSVVIKNAQLADNLEALREAMIAIATEHDRQPLLEAIVTQAVALLSAKGGGIYEYDQLREELEIIAVHQHPNELFGMKIMQGEGLSGRLIISEDPYVAFPDYSACPFRSSRFDNYPTFESVLAVPLIWKTNRIGVLWVNAERNRAFAVSEIDILTRLAALASITFEQSRLREREHNKIERLQKLASATNDIVGKSGTGNQESRLTLIAEHARTILNAQECGIHLVLRPGYLTLVASSGHRDGAFERGRQFLIKSEPRSGLIGHIAYTKKVFRECDKALTEHPHVKDRDATCHSLLVVPMKSENEELRGLIRISNKLGKDGRPHPGTCFTEDDESIAEIFAQAAAVEIEMADLIDEIKKGEHRYKTLLDAYQVLVQARSLDQGLEKIAQIVMKLLDKSFCRVLLLGDDGESLRAIAAAKRMRNDNNFAWNPRLNEVSRLGDWAEPELIFNSPRPAVLNHERADNSRKLVQMARWLDLKDQNGAPIELQSLLSIPLKFDGKRLGLLNVGELRTRTRFSDSDKERGKAIAAQISAMIERLERDREFLYELFKTENEINSSKDLETTLRLITVQVYEVARRFSRNVIVANINLRSGNRVKPVAAYPDGWLSKIRSIVGAEFDLKKEKKIGIVGKVIQTGNWVNESDVLKNPDYIVFDEQTRSQLAVPIRDGNGTVIGVISVENSEVDDFNHHDIRVIEGLAVQAASAILRTQQSLDNKKARTVALLGAAASVWTHNDLKAALDYIVTNAEYATANLQKPDVVLKGLQSIVNKARALLEKDVTEVLSPENVTEPILLNDVIKTRTGRLREAIAKLPTDINPPPRVTSNLDATTGRMIYVDETWFHYALKIFLVNALEATRVASQRVIDVQTEILDDSNCRISIKNTGPKIPVDIWEKLGNEQVVTTKDTHNKGVGLLIADLILAVYGAKIEKIANEDNNIILGIKLPLAD